MALYGMDITELLIIITAITGLFFALRWVRSRLPSKRRPAAMKPVGILCVVVGLIWAAIAVNMDTTVVTGGERIGSGLYSVDIPITRVHNLGLMEERRNNLIMASVAVLVGVMLFGFGSVSKPASADETKPCPYCAELIKRQAKICRFCQKEVPPVGATEAETTDAVGGP